MLCVTIKLIGKHAPFWHEENSCIHYVLLTIDFGYMIVEDVEVSGNVRYMICSYINTILYPQGTDPRRDCVVSLATATKR